MLSSMKVGGVRRIILEIPRVLDASVTLVMAAKDGIAWVLERG